jgi:sodium-coupled neutral amino acid transporter 11
MSKNKKSSSSSSKGTPANTTSTAAAPPPSPFFAPQTPHREFVQQTPGGTRRKVQEKTGAVPENKSSLAGCTANLINAIVGSGIVGIPYAVKMAGFGAGLFLIIMCAILTEKSLRLLIFTAKHLHVPSYETAAEAAFGVIGFRFIALNMFIMAYGAMLSYLMIVKDSFSLMVGVDPDDLYMKRAILVAVSLTIMVPLSSQRDMANLSFTSRFSVVIDSILVLLVAINAPISESMERIGGLSTLFTASQIIHWDTIFVGLGVLSFAFVCQHSAFIIAGSLDRPTVKRWSNVTRSALMLCACLALTCGATGYLGFLDDTQGNVLNNLSDTSVSAMAARGMLGVTMLFVFPLECFVARHVCVVILFQGRRAHEGDDSTILNRRDRRIGLTVLLYLIAVVPAAAFEDLGPVLAISGAVGGSCLAYVGPGLVYLGVHGARFLELVQASWLGSKLGEYAFIDPNNNSNSNANNAKNKNRPVEMTPLVAAGKAQVVANNKAVSKETSQEQAQDDSFVVGFLKSVVWYTSAMPVWCAIAAAGRQGVSNHIHDMALKSPHPIRIGDVEYTRVLLERSDGNADAEQGLVIPPRGLLRQDSLPPTKTKKGGSGGGVPNPYNPNMINSNSLHAHTQKQTHTVTASPININQRIGQSLLKKQQQKQKEVEKDPQEEPPSWNDFVIAIFYILFGALAFFAGLLSISQSQ